MKFLNSLDISCVRQSGKNWGSLRGKIFLTVCRAKRGLGCERLRLCASAESKPMKIFTLLKEKLCTRPEIKIRSFCWPWLRHGSGAAEPRVRCRAVGAASLFFRNF